MLGDARLATEFADEMLEKGIYVIGFSYPVVPQGEIFQQAFSWSHVDYTYYWIVLIDWRMWDKAIGLMYIEMSAPLNCHTAYDNYVDQNTLYGYIWCQKWSKFCSCWEFCTRVYEYLYSGEARIRVQISAVHSQADLDQCLQAFIEIGKRRGVISWVKMTVGSFRSPFLLSCI